MAGRDPQELFGKDGLVDELKKALSERILNTELDAHLGSEVEKNSGNHRNGVSKKSMLTGTSKVTLDIPRDRAGEFAPILLGEFERRTERIDDLILCLYAKGMSTRDIGDILKAIYGKKASAQTVTNLTQKVEEEREAWCNRKLRKKYVAVFVDALMVKIRREVVSSDAIYLILGVNEEGKREVLSLVVGASESAGEWKEIFKGLRKRGVEEILVGIMDGLAGLEEGFLSVYPKALTQLCVVHQMRSSLVKVRAKHKEEMAEDLRSIYQSGSYEAAENQLEKIKTKWNKMYPRVFVSWEENLPRLMTFLAFPKPLQKSIYTTNWIERLNKELRKVTKTKNSFPTEGAVLNLLYLKLKDIEDRWENRTLKGFIKYQLDLHELWERRYQKRSKTITHKS